MKKRIPLTAGLLISAVGTFGQGLPALHVTQADMVGHIFRCAGDSETVVEVQSSLPLTFESTIDGRISFCNTKHENNFYVYQLVFTADPVQARIKTYKGRKLQIQAPGFDAYMHPLNLEPKKHVKCVVERVADYYYNQRNYDDALREYEKIHAVNPNDDYVTGRIDRCNKERALELDLKKEIAKARDMARAREKEIHDAAQKVDAGRQTPVQTPGQTPTVSRNDTGTGKTDKTSSDQTAVAADSKTGNEQKLIFTFKDTKQKLSAKLYMDEQFIGEVNSDNKFQLHHSDKKPGRHRLRIVWSSDVPEWKGEIYTDRQTEFRFGRKKTGFGFEFGRIK